MIQADPIKMHPDDPSLPGILELVRNAFAYMEARINPPSSMHRMTVASIKDQCVSGEVWTIGRPPHACIFLKEQVDSLYVGKMAVSDAMRGRGCARQLIRLAADRARSKRLPVLELETRIELHENHETFRRLGFVKVGEGAHAGFDRPTYIVMRKPV